LTRAKAQSTPRSEEKVELSWKIVHRYSPTFPTLASLREIFGVSVAADRGGVLERKIALKLRSHAFAAPRLRLRSALLG
jgi:hypothetical protein